MTDFLTAAALILGATFLLALVPMVRSAHATDRMLAAQLLGTNGVGLLLILALLLDLEALIDVALVLALLATVALVAFTRRPAAATDQRSATLDHPENQHD